MPTTADRRRPRRVYGVGTDPDARFSLANERTFLAWIRTSIALLAAGVALEALELPVHVVLRWCAAILLVLLGVLAAAWAWVAWARVERAIRTGDPLPPPVAGAVVSVGVGVAGLLLVVGLLVA